jgi:hypothetical protein
MVNTLAVDQARERLAVITQLLQHAAADVWIHADQANPAYPLRSLGLGVHLAQAQASALLPADYEFPAVDFGGRSPLQLLTAAEELTRRLPLHSPDLAGGSKLAIDLCDLIREARELGY